LLGYMRLPCGGACRAPPSVPTIAVPMKPNINIVPPNDANRLGLVYRHEAHRLPWRGEIWDVHTHIRDVEAARAYFEAAEVFGVRRVWTMTNLEEVDAIREAFPD